MQREELKELHYITSIKNVPSIMKYGILSNRMAQKIEHVSIALEGVQEWREKKRVPQGLRLHDYANLYICARNPMLYLETVVWERPEICVLRVKSDVLDLPDVVITDMNAARNLARFEPASVGLRKLDKDLIFADDWNDPDPNEKDRKSGVKCAEVLVPNSVPVSYIFGAYVSCKEDEKAFGLTRANISVTINPHLFFQ
jgi:hypothetical protein